MPSGLSQSHQEIAGQFQRELLQLICLGSGGQHVQRPLPRGMGRPIGLQCPCNSFTRQEVRGASDSTNQRIENNALVSSSGLTGGARRVVYLVTSCSPVRGSCDEICGGCLQQTVCPGHTRGCAGRYTGETATDEIQLKCFTCK